MLPVVLDVGTNNVELRNDPKYLGLKRPRITGEAYYNIVDEVGSSGGGGVKGSMGSSVGDRLLDPVLLSS